MVIDASEYGANITNIITLLNQRSNRNFYFNLVLFFNCVMDNLRVAQFSQLDCSGGVAVSAPVFNNPAQANILQAVSDIQMCHYLTDDEKAFLIANVEMLTSYWIGYVNTLYHNKLAPAQHSDFLYNLRASQMVGYNLFEVNEDIAFVNGLDDGDSFVTTPIFGWLQ